MGSEGKHSTLELNVKVLVKLLPMKKSQIESIASTPGMKSDEELILHILGKLQNSQ